MSFLRLSNWSLEWRKLTFSVCGSFSSTEELKDVVVCTAWVEPGPCSKAALLFLECSSLAPPFSDCVYTYALSHSLISDSLRLHWTIAQQASLFMRFSRQEYWSELPFLSPEDLLNPGVETESVKKKKKKKQTKKKNKTKKRNWISCVCRIASRYFTCWAIEEALPSVISSC